MRYKHDKQHESEEYKPKILVIVLTCIVILVLMLL